VTDAPARAKRGRAAKAYPDAQPAKPAEQPAEPPAQPDARPSMAVAPPRTSLFTAAEQALMANAGKYSRGLVLAAFQNIGGLRRLTETADEDPKWFYDKLFAKLVQPERAVVAEADDDVEALLQKLDREVVDV